MHSWPTRPVGAACTAPGSARRAGSRGSWPRGSPTAVARARPSGSHQRDVRPRDRQDARPTRTAPPTPGRPAGRAPPSGWPGRNGARWARTATGPTPGPPPPWGMQNVLCRLRWLTSAPKRPGRATPDEGVEVGAVDVDLAAGVVDGGADLADRLLEHAVRRRVGDHDRRPGGRRPARAWSRRSSTSTLPPLVGGDDDDVEPGHHRAGRVRAVGARRDQAHRALRRRRASGGRRGWRAARRARPGCRRWAAR